jgi:organic radical activating enzyme
MNIKKNNLYEMPWQMYDCPNGWIEPTTFCNLKCPQCYRGCDRLDHRPEHRQLEDLKKEVDSFIKDRNIQTISIAGGEPLLYPNLNELIKFIKDKNLSILLITNGVLLDKKRLLELKELKVDTIILHIGNYQNREKITTIEDSNVLRAKYCEMFRQVKEVNLGFILPVSQDNLADLPEILKFCRQNSDVVRLIDFTIMDDLFNHGKYEFIKRVNFGEIAQKVQDIYGIEYCAYIGKTVTDEISWLWGSAVFSGNKFLGSTDGNFMKVIQEDYYKKNKKYLFSNSKANLSLLAIIKLIINRSIIKILSNYIVLKSKGKINWQLLLIINGPKAMANQIDLCKCCPDAMYWQGKLVPSCSYSRITDEKDKYAQNKKYYCDEYI